MAPKSASFRVGKVRAYLRGSVWYLAYQEEGKRCQPRVGSDREVALQLASEINGQLQNGAPSALGFQSVSIPELQNNWLEHHELVRRSSLATICRYRTASKHLLDFVEVSKPIKRVSDFRSQHATEFVRYLRLKKVAPNGHKNTRHRNLRDAGIKFILETCCSMFNFAMRQRNLPPYAENPFKTIEVFRLPVEDSKMVVPFTADQEVQLIQSCDSWQLPVFLTLLLTGMRPGELVHLLLPEDVDLENGWLRIRNKKRLGWQIKTRNERDIPLLPALKEVLQQLIGARTHGPVFRQPRCQIDHRPILERLSSKALELELAKRLNAAPPERTASVSREYQQTIAKTIWRDIGAIKEDVVRTQFIRLTKKMGIPEITAPKTLRHTFATILQDANVDPLVRKSSMNRTTRSECWSFRNPIPDVL